MAEVDKEPQEIRAITRSLIPVNPLHRELGSALLSDDILRIAEHISTSEDADVPERPIAAETRLRNAISELLAEQNTPAVGAEKEVRRAEVLLRLLQHNIIHNAASAEYAEVNVGYIDELSATRVIGNTGELKAHFQVGVAPENRKGVLSDLDRLIQQMETAITERWKEANQRALAALERAPVIMVSALGSREAIIELHEIQLLLLSPNPALRENDEEVRQQLEHRRSVLAEQALAAVGLKTLMPQQDQPATETEPDEAPEEIEKIEVVILDRVQRQRPKSDDVERIIRKIMDEMDCIVLPEVLAKDPPQNMLQCILSSEGTHRLDIVFIDDKNEKFTRSYDTSIDLDDANIIRRAVESYLFDRDDIYPYYEVTKEGTGSGNIRRNDHLPMGKSSKTKKLTSAILGNEGDVYALKCVFEETRRVRQEDKSYKDVIKKVEATVPLGVQYKIPDGNVEATRDEAQAAHEEAERRKEILLKVMREKTDSRQSMTKAEWQDELIKDLAGVEKKDRTDSEEAAVVKKARNDLIKQKQWHRAQVIPVEAFKERVLIGDGSNDQNQQTFAGPACVQRHGDSFAIRGEIHIKAGGEGEQKGSEYRRVFYRKIGTLDPEAAKIIGAEFMERLYYQLERLHSIGAVWALEGGKLVKENDHNQLLFDPITLEHQLINKDGLQQSGAVCLDRRKLGDIITDSFYRDRDNVHPIADLAAVTSTQRQEGESIVFRLQLRRAARFNNNEAVLHPIRGKKDIEHIGNPVEIGFRVKAEDEKLIEPFIAQINASLREHANNEYSPYTNPTTDQAVRVTRRSVPEKYSPSRPIEYFSDAVATVRQREEFFGKVVQLKEQARGAANRPRS
ncbi:MAG: hypothetical protein EB060_04580 [Proteobacteria bacterium]|nr:hypothetical protein [Pseudomonadota bacterium]